MPFDHLLPTPPPPSTQKFLVLNNAFVVFILYKSQAICFCDSVAFCRNEAVIISGKKLLSRSSRKCGRRWKSGWRQATSGHTWAWFWLERILQVSPMSSTKPELLPAWVCVTLRPQLLLNWDLSEANSVMAYTSLPAPEKKPSQRRLLWFNWIKYLSGRNQAVCWGGGL